MVHITCHMKTAAVRQVRQDFSSVFKPFESGEEATRDA